MQNILLFMRRKVLSTALSKVAEAEKRMCFFTETNSDNIIIAAKEYRADIILVEAAESGVLPVEESLCLCDEIRRELPDCKILLLCSENNMKDRGLAILAKRKGRIDDFVFYDTSIDYLISKLKSM